VGIPSKHIKTTRCKGVQWPETPSRSPRWPLQRQVAHQKPAGCDALHGRNMLNRPPQLDVLWFSTMKCKKRIVDACHKPFSSSQFWGNQNEKLTPPGGEETPEAAHVRQSNAVWTAAEN